MKHKKLLVLILLLTIGFAAVSTTLVLNGVVNIASNTKEFEVYFSNAVENGKVRKSLIKDDTHIAFTVDMSLVGEKYELVYDVTNGSKNYDAELTLVHTESNEYVKITNEFETDTNLLATETRSGTLTIEVVKPYVGTEEEPTKEIEVTCTITAKAIERDNLATGTPADKAENPWSITQDNDSDGVLSKGDLITLGSESFYVYDIEGDNVKAISQYNLYVGGQVKDSSYTVTPIENPTGLQSPDSIGVRENFETMEDVFPWVGTVPFMSQTIIDTLTEGQKANDYSISDIKEQVDAYATKLNELDGEVRNVRLITKEELEAAGCDSEKNSCRAGYDYSSGMKEDATVTGAPEYLWSTTYWTSSASAEGDSFVWYVYSGGLCAWNLVSDDDVAGVRPVIEISKSLF